MNEAIVKFFSGLFLLIWKNWLVRKRNKIKGLLEIIWPVLTVLMLLVLCEIGEKTHMPNCHTKLRAMPSAGEVLFLQSFLCAFNNTCDMEKNASYPCFNFSVLENLKTSFVEAFLLKPTENASFDYPASLKMKSETKRWLKDFMIAESIMQVLNKNKKESQKKNTFDIFKPKYPLNLTCEIMIKLPKKKKKRSVDNLDSHRTIKSNPLQLDAMGKKVLLSKSLGDSEKIQFDVLERKGWFKAVDFFLCGPNATPVKEQIEAVDASGKSTGQGSFKPPMFKSSSFAIEDFIWENDTTPYCNNLMKQLENTYSSRALFRLYKPLMRGKLVYTPKAPVINRIMERLQSQLNFSKLINHLSEKMMFQKEEKDFHALLQKYRTDKKFIKKLIESDLGKALLEEYGKANPERKDKEKNMQYMLDKAIENMKINRKVNNRKDFLDFAAFVECLDENRIIPAENESAAVEEALRWLNTERLWGVLVFNVSEDAKELPSSITYKIRTGIERTGDTNYIRDRIFTHRVKRDMLYDLREITGGFAYLQDLVEGELIKEFTGRTNLPGIYLKQTPFPCHMYNSFRHVITRTFPMFMVISWIYLFCLVCSKIVTEKQILFKGTLRFYGVTRTQHWLSWFIDAIVPTFFVTLIISVLLVVGGLLPNSSILVIWMFLMTFSFPTITLAFMVSTFFFRASLALGVSGMIFFLLYLPYPPIQNFGDLLHPAFKFIACLISNVAFGSGCTWIAQMEETGFGAQLDKIYDSPIPENPINMAIVLKFFLLDGFLYLLLTLYFDNVIAARDFITEPWYFCFTRSYWRRFGKIRRLPDDYLYSTPRARTGKEYFDTPGGLPVGIEVINLTKEYGRNGAGKTTAISMMIGAIPITVGTVRTYGIDVRENSSAYYGSIGICRQENVLLNELTVEEHFILFSKLRNLNFKNPEMNIAELIEDLQLGMRAKQPVEILSGGMKRKVCVAMAFIGGSRAIFLDEPTAGVDPYSRRSIWTLLAKYKKGRTIILTTHFLDEADILGDRIAIISSGVLQCYGTGPFLKSILTMGYYLTIRSEVRSEAIERKNEELEENPPEPEIMKQEDYDAEQDQDKLVVVKNWVKNRISNKERFQANVTKALGYKKPLTEDEEFIQELTQLVQHRINAAEFVRHAGGEIVYQLPTGTQAATFAALFQDLDRNRKRLKFNSYALSEATLEEVFLKILKENNEEYENETAGRGLSFQKKRRKERRDRSRDGANRVKPPTLSSRKIWTANFSAIVNKRCLHQRRNYKVLLIEFLLPTLFMAIALGLVRLLPGTTDLPPLNIDMSKYGPSILFYNNEFPENIHTTAYEAALLSPEGFGTTCINTPQNCTLREIQMDTMRTYNDSEDKLVCSCDNDVYECKKNSSLKEIPKAKLSEGDELYNLTGLDISKWLLSTEHKHSAHRFGGMTFGHFEPLAGVSVYRFIKMIRFQYLHILTRGFEYKETSIKDPNVFTRLLMAGACHKPYVDGVFWQRDMTDNIIIWYNNRGLIASLAMMNGVSNIVLRASLPSNVSKANYSINLINHPLPSNKRQMEHQMELQTNVALLSALSFIWALSFIPAMYAVYLVEENTSGLKNLEIIAGMYRTAYWFANLTYDLLSYTISIAPILCLFILFGMTEFIGFPTIPTFVILIYSYGFVNIAFVCMISFFFTVPSTAFIFVACVNIMAGIGTILTSHTLNLISSKDNPFYLNTIFMIFPQFCFGQALINMAAEGIARQSLETLGVTVVPALFAWDTALKYITCMLILGIIFFFITLGLEFNYFESLNFSKRRKEKKKIIYDLMTALPELGEDYDVKKERERVESGQAAADGDILILNNLMKMYYFTEPPAVNRVCVGVKSGECFGLLGLNGAGKSTIFKMLTNNISVTGGDATIGGYSIRNDPGFTKLLIGYCPQGDALDRYLSIKEHLRFFSRIRGYREERVEYEINANLQRFGLTKMKDTLIKNLSGGDKRKVSTAIAFIGEPELILLDEPTTGMDIVSRRYLWRCLHDRMVEGRSFVLTTHSMEECEALCTKISVMANGRFTCFGTIQHLKLKFTEGTSVNLTLYDIDDVDTVVDFFNSYIPNSQLVYIRENEIKYNLNPELLFGDVFVALSRAKEENIILDFAVTHIPLDRIFLQIAPGIDNPEQRKKSRKSRCCRKQTPPEVSESPSEEAGAF